MKERVKPNLAESMGGILKRVGLIGAVIGLVGIIAGLKIGETVFLASAGTGVVGAAGERVARSKKKHK